MSRPIRRAALVCLVILLGIAAIWLLRPTSSVETETSAVTPSKTLHRSASHQAAINAAARPGDRTVLTKLNLSRAPSEADLRAAAPLREPLIPLKNADTSRDDDNIAFGHAIQAWNSHRFGKAYDLLTEHLKDFPNSPWSAETRLHLAEWCRDHGRFAEAGNHLSAVLESVPEGTPLWHKARHARVLLNLASNDTAEAQRDLAAIHRNDPDPNHKTLASYWLRELSMRSGVPAISSYVPPSDGALWLVSSTPGIQSLYIGDLGDDPCACKNCGMPGWSVNMVNFNFRVSDTPIWWDAPVGPSVHLTIHYNSLDTDTTITPFGAKWSFAYASWLILTETATDRVAVVRDGDGRKETFTVPITVNTFPRTYTAPPGDTRELVETADHVFTLTQRDGTVFHYAVPNAMSGSVPFLTSIMDRHQNSLTVTHNSAGAITEIAHSALTAPDNKWTFDYTNIELPDNAGTVSRVETITDPFNRTASFAYDGNANLTGQSDMGGLAYSYQYTDTGELFISGITTPKGTTTIATEPSDGGTIDPNNFPTGYTPGYPPLDSGIMGENYRIRVTNAAQHTEEYHYDSTNWTGYHRDPIQLAAAANPSATGAPAIASQYTLISGKGRVTSVQTPFSQYSESGFDPFNRLPTETTDELGTTWREYYQSGAAQGQLEYIRLPKSADEEDTDYEIRFEWATNGKDLKSVKRNLNGVEKTLASYTYHHVGDNCTNCTPRDLHTITDATGRTLTCTWLTNGLPDTITDSLTGDVVTFTYDSNNRPYQVKVNDTVMGTTAFDLEGRLLSTLSVNDYYTEYQYDGLNRLIRENHPDGSFIEHVWQCCFISETKSGKTIDSQDRILQRTVYHHDSLGRVDRVTDTAGRTTRYAYDDAGRLTHLTDAANQTTEWVFDPNTGLLTNKIYPGGSLQTAGTYETYGWTNGLLTSFINRRGQTTGYEYDSHGNLDLTTTPEAVTETDFDTWDRPEYLYHTPTGGSLQTHHLVHDLLGRLTSLDGPWTNDTIGWEYLDSQRKVIRTTPGSVTTEILGDAYGRLTSVINSLGTFTNGYSGASNQLLSVTHSGGFSTALTYYDETQRQALHTITSTLPGNNVIARHTYGYDNEGRMDAWHREAILANSTGPTRSYDWTLRHDFASQLTDVIESPTSSSSVQAAWHYGYDSAGNLTTMQHTPAANQPLAVTTRAHNGLNQITGLSGGGKTLIRGTLNEPGNVAIGRTGMGDSPAKMTDDSTFEAELDLPAGTNSITVTAQDPSGNKRTNTYQVQTATQAARTFTYDYDGNLESDGERTYQWDGQSRLTKVTWATGVTTTFVYNGLGQRSTRIDSDGTNTVTRHYLFDGISLIDRRTGVDADTAAIDRRYYPQGEQRLDGTTWTTYHYCRDHLSSVREVVKSDGTLAARYDFDPYGKRLVQYESTAYTSGGACDLGFTGHITQPSPVAGQNELPLAHYRAYDPALGRWLSPDPIRESGGINIYLYCSGSPAMLIDPFGLDDEGGFWYNWVLKPVAQFIMDCEDQDREIAKANEWLSKQPTKVQIAHRQPFVPPEWIINFSDHKGKVLVIGVIAVLSDGLIRGGVSTGAPKCPGKDIAAAVDVEQFYIQNGVRRAVSSREAGLADVPATIYRPGQAPQNATIPLNQLHSPKPEIPCDKRFQAITPPIRTPIEVEPIGLPMQMPTTPLPDVPITGKP